MAEVSISAFAADILHLERDLDLALRSGADSVHIDVMDGHFVPLFGFSQIWIRRLAAWDTRCGDVHLMAFSSRELVESLLFLPIRRLTLHVESAREGEKKELLRELLALIREKGIQAGLALSPGSEPEALCPYFPYIDEVLVMSASPGTEDSAYLENTCGRIREVRELIQKSGFPVRIAVDGSLNEERAKACIRKGADRVIIGRAFFAGEERKEMIERVRRTSAGDL